MAHKLPRDGTIASERARPAASGEDDSPAAELAALAPDVPLEIAGRKFTVREYGVLEGVQIAAEAEAFIDDLVARARAGKFTYKTVRPVIGKHMDTVVDLVARSTGQEPEWIRGIADRSQMDLLLMTWFGVNAGFFVHEVVGAIQVERMEAAAARAGSTSSPGSVRPGSAISTASDA